MARSPDIPRSTNLFDQIGGLLQPVTQTDDGWIVVGDPNDEISPAWQNSWIHADTAKPVSFFLDPNGIVRFRGEAEGGDDGTIAFTLPVGYRPEFQMSFVGTSATGDRISRLQVDPNGDVRIMSSGSVVTDTSAIHAGDTPASGDLQGTFPNLTLKPGSNGFWKTVSGALTRVTTVAWSELTGIPSTFTPSAHKNSHKTGGSDAFVVADLLDAIARVGVRKNSAGSTFSRRRVNLIEGSNVTITVADDSTDEEVDVTIAATGGGGGSVATDTIFDAKGDLPVGTGSDTAAKLTVGSNDTIPIADSSQSTGIRWGSIDGGSA
jgi:hypothetical protein